jgi:ubiquinone/menaquinone biosynthesis C-methylase UbiE
MNVFVSLRGAQRILDFGCGTGWVLGQAATEGNPLRVGLDLSLESLTRANAQNPNVRYVCANGLNLPFQNASFDMVIGHVSLPYMNTKRALREIYRVLRPGGSIFLTLHSPHYVKDRVLRSLSARRWRDVLFCAYMATNGILNHFSLPQFRWPSGRLETVNTPTGVYRAARNEGFVMISIEHVAKRIFFAVTARKPNANAGAVLAAPGWSIYCPLRRESE